MNLQSKTTCMGQAERLALLAQAAQLGPLAIPPAEPVITIYDTLGPGHLDGHELARQIWALERDGHCRVHIRINSSGGSVLHGYSLFAALRHTTMEVHTWLDGMALSMAGLLFLAGRVRHMAPWSLLFLHNPLLLPPDPALPADAMQAATPTATTEADAEADRLGELEILGRIRNSLLLMYEACTRLAPNQLGSMMDSETWLTAAEAKALGLISDFGDETIVPNPDLEQRLRAELANAHTISQPMQAAERMLAMAASYTSLGKAIGEETDTGNDQLPAQAKVIPALEPSTTTLSEPTKKAAERKPRKRLGAEELVESKQAHAEFVAKADRVTGKVTGNVTGMVTGPVTAPVTGPVTSPVTSPVQMSSETGFMREAASLLVELAVARKQIDPAAKEHWLQAALQDYSLAVALLSHMPKDATPAEIPTKPTPTVADKHAAAMDSKGDDNGADLRKDLGADKGDKPVPSPAPTPAPKALLAPPAALAMWRAHAYGKQADYGGGNERSDWGFRDWERQDPKGLDQLRAGNLRRFEQLYLAAYGVLPYQ